jgi:hypothetical protein
MKRVTIFLDSQGVPCRTHKDYFPGEQTLAYKSYAAKATNSKRTNGLTCRLKHMWS